MGSVQGANLGNKKQTVLLPGENPEDSFILRHPDTLVEFIESEGPGLDTMDKCMLHYFSQYAKSPMLGTQKGKDYVWKSYEEVQKLCIDFGSGLMHLNLCPLEEHDGYMVRFIVVYSLNREEWNIADIGSLLYQVSNVPFYESLSPDSISYILGQTSANTLVLSSDKISIICDLKAESKSHSLKNIISMDTLTPELKNSCQILGLNIYDFSEILEIGRLNPQPVPKTTVPNNLYAISYTSGTTGFPKGVIITHKMMVSELVYIKNLLKPHKGDSYLSYLPAAHLYEKVMSNMFYMVGAKLGFYSGDPVKLKDDICTLKPSFLVCVPRILNRFADLVNSILLNEPENRKVWIEKMINEKIENMKQYGTVKHTLYDNLYFNKFKDLFGGRVRIGITAAAASNGDTIDRLKVILGVNFVNAYGQTEVAGAATCSSPDDFESGHVGGPGTCCEIKLVDIPDMGYTKNARDSNNNPTPTGEICFRGASVFPKYFKNPQATSDSFDSLGWLHSGDVGKMLPDGRIAVIDRKKSFLKLSHGEYVSPEKIENVNMQSKFLAFNFVYGNPLQSYLVAVVVPDRMIVEPEAKKLGIEGDWEEICKNSKIKDLIIEDIDINGRKQGLSSIELVKRIYIHPSPITAESGLLTPTFKMKRKELKEYFFDELEALYHHHR